MNKINLDTLLLYDNIRQNEIVMTAVKILNEMAEKEEISHLEPEYYAIQRELLACTDGKEAKGTYWENYVCRLIAESENQFSLLGEKGGFDTNIFRIASREVSVLKLLFAFDWERISGLFHDRETCICLMDRSEIPEEFQEKREKIRLAMESDDDQESIELLFEHYHDNACGIYQEYDAFVWDGRLIGVRNYDKISFEQLVGYEKQKEALIENTEVFLNGYRTNNVLLYGDRGTGKSSCVKALLNKFKDRRLKIISLNKNDVNHLYQIIESIANRGCKFIIYIDDLSFEDTETGYKYFKSIIDGGIEAQPTNAVLYVTSNRKNIIRETWRDRGDLSAENEVHRNDALQEKLSLADRFGLTITFSAPDKLSYLEIVKSIACQEGLDYDEDLLKEEALRWELRQHGRSGRSARQFIYHMQAKTLKQEPYKRRGE
ncbi:ATP-binding protein [Sinanaerobacter chloroacetimidivorans]|uniref:ATP-binding protein n=1 Tax=Sinanaerobacter chloroacetimidivorans TaxID=2818044 RepID=A0A8J7W4C5_9FIRM|nr:ATP-binding protein [Sinanaerobacter chloroacetimidivorans]MBR0598893.1 ATP-binding protein [Sinanaerobacter chloroacetimidivorans]